MPECKPRKIQCRASSSFNRVEALLLQTLVRKALTNGQTSATEQAVLDKLLKKAASLVAKTGELQSVAAESTRLRCASQPDTGRVYEAYRVYRAEGGRSVAAFAEAQDLEPDDVRRFIAAGRRREGHVDAPDRAKPLTAAEFALGAEYVAKRLTCARQFGLVTTLARKHGVQPEKGRIVCKRAWRDHENERAANHGTDTDLGNAAE